MKTKASKLATGQIFLQNVRLSYPKLFKAVGMQGQPDSTPRYGASFLIPKEDTATIEFIQAELAALAKDKLKTNKVKDSDSCFRDGDNETSDGYAGMMFISAARYPDQGRPQVLDRDGKSPLTAEDAKIQAGYYVNAIISLYVPKTWKKLCASLEVVQLVKTGETFGAPPVDTSVLPDVSDDEDEDDGLGD